jgi:predicted RNA-binding protein YlqC (UPF0109 family)
LVDNQGEISINEIENEKNITLQVKVSKEDMGKVIGKEGRIAKSIRNILKAVGAKEHKKVTVEFLD